MRRDSTVLLVVILVLGVICWGVRHGTDARRATATSLVFAIQSGTSSYRIEFHPDSSGVGYIATLGQQHENGQMTAAAYQEFLRGFVQAGGQGLDALALVQPSLLADLPDESTYTCRPPAAHLAPMAQARRVRSLTKNPPSTSDVAPSNNPTYWYEIAQDDQQQHFTLNPFDSKGRRLLSYLQTTVVFACWQRLGGS